jgi:HK97 gp10 family phage protein
MRVSNWQPQKFDGEFFNASMDRLERAAEVIASKARARAPIGESRAQYKSGKDYTSRESGALKASVRVVRLYDQKARNVRVYAGSRKVYYARFVEFGTVKMSAKPFLRPALNSSKAEIRSILEGS